MNNIDEFGKNLEKDRNSKFLLRSDDFKNQVDSKSFIFSYKVFIILKFI